MLISSTSSRPLCTSQALRHKDLHAVLPIGAELHAYAHEDAERGAGTYQANTPARYKRQDTGPTVLCFGRGKLRPACAAEG
jgi:hypothetical protein